MRNQDILLKTALCAAVAVPVMTPATAHAAGFRVEVDQCRNQKGSIALQDVGADAWGRMGVGNPSAFLTSMVEESGCFTVVNSPSAAKYKLVFGPLTQVEYESGPEAFSGQSALAGGIPSGGSRPELPELKDLLGSMLSGGKMRYAYVDILDAKGQTIARGFGRNNRSKLDYSHWVNDQRGIRAFNRNKKSLTAGGAMYNAFDDVQNVVVSPAFGKGGTFQANTGASNGVMLSELFRERSDNGESFNKRYDPKRGGRYMTVLGYVQGTSVRSANLQMASSPTGGVSPVSRLECVMGSRSAGQLLRSYKKGDRVSVTGKVQLSELSVGYPPVHALVIFKCQVNGPWDPMQLGGTTGGLGPAFATVPLGNLVAQATGNKFGYLRKYKGKVIKVVGPLSSVRETEKGLKITMKDRKIAGFKGEIDCLVPGSQADKAADLIPGRNVTIKGIVFDDPSERFNAVTLKQCQLD